MKEGVLRGISDVILENDYMWIITDSLNSLFKYSFRSKELELVAVFPEMMRCDFEPYSRIVKLEDEIYFIPRMAKDIYYYNVIEKRFHALNIPFDNFQDDKRLSVMVCDKNIYCVNRFPDTVIKINSVTKKSNTYSLDLNIKADRDIEKTIYTSYRFLCICNQKIIWSNYNDMLTIFDIETESFSVIVLDDFPHEKIKESKKIFGKELNDWIVGVRSFNDMLWLCTYEDRIYIYNNGLQKINNKLFEKCRESHDSAGIQFPIFRDILATENELWFIPTFKNKCIIFNSKTQQYEEALDDYIKNWKVDIREYSINRLLSNGKILLFSYFENLFYIINREDNSISNFEEIKYPYKEFIKENRFFEKMIMKDNIYPFDDLLFLLDRVNHDSLLMRENASKNMGIGKEIFGKLQ